MKPPAEAYPLYWPEHWKRTPKHRRSKARYDTTQGKAIRDLSTELKRWRAKHIVISSNVSMRRDGLPYANMRQPQDPGVAVYFMKSGEQQVIACDRWDHVKDNFRACFHTIAALRTIERAGATEVLRRAFDGFKALPAAQPEERRDPWWVVLGVPQGYDDLEVLEIIYKKKARTAHPDVGGSDGAMAELNRAWEEAKGSIG